MSTLRDDEVLDEEQARPNARPVPGVLVCWSDGPRCVALPLVGGALEIGRDQLRDAGVDDSRVSARHLLIERRRDRFFACDRGSTNGSFFDGAPSHEPPKEVSPRVARIGRTLLLLLDDVGPFLSSPVRVDGGIVLGPRLKAVRERIARLAAAAQHVLVTGETGTGKELMARAFHEAARRPGAPFVAVNCAAIPRDLGERLLFGARRGAFSGAIDAEGYLAAASGGTLFLDEIGEIDIALQAKLLRVIEHHEVMPLGATRATPIDLRLCAATHRDLRRDVARGSFRSDLYFRVGRPAVRIPPLRERPEEIPYLVEHAVRGVPGADTLEIAVPFVEACLLRSWPGNVRELAFESRAAAIQAVAERRGIDAADLDLDAGIELPEEEPPGIDVGPQSLRAVLVSTGGNLSQAAKRLGIPRSTLRRLLSRHGIDLEAIRGES